MRHSGMLLWADAERSREAIVHQPAAMLSYAGPSWTKLSTQGAGNVHHQPKLAAPLCLGGSSRDAPSLQQGVPAGRHRQQFTLLLVKLQLGNVKDVVKKTTWKHSEALCAQSG